MLAQGATPTSWPVITVAHIVRLGILVCRWAALQVIGHVAQGCARTQAPFSSLLGLCACDVQRTLPVIAFIIITIENSITWKGLCQGAGHHNCQVL